MRMRVLSSSLVLLHFLISMMASGNPPGTRTNLNSIQATRDYLQQAMVQLDRADPSKFYPCLKEDKFYHT